MQTIIREETALNYNIGDTRLTNEYTCFVNTTDNKLTAKAFS